MAEAEAQRFVERAGGEPDGDAATLLPDGAATRSEGSNSQKRRETGRVRCNLDGMPSWFERIRWGSGFAERIDRHRRSSLIERGLTKWSSAANEVSPLQRRVRPNPHCA